MDNNQKASAGKHFGFYDRRTNIFYKIPAPSLEELNQLLQKFV